MKTFVALPTLIAMLAAPAGSAQTAAALATPRPPNAPAAPAAKPAPAGQDAQDDREIGPQIAEQVEVLVKEAARSAKDAARTANDAVRSALKSAHSALWESDSPAFQFGGGARSSSRSLAIVTTGADPEKIDDIEDDLSVMARILQKAARSLRDDERFNAMGIDLDSSVFGSASGARNLYVEGHGALFLLSVRYPLVGPAGDAPADPAPAPDTEWERTREEVLGNNPPQSEHDDITLYRSSRGKAEPYDETKVAGLKLALLNALTNASNIRHLAPAEFVTVVVQGGDATEGGVRVITTSPAPGASNRAEVRVRKEIRASVDAGRKSSAKSESVLMLRVKKSDLDAVAAGRMGADDFRQRASVSTYLRRSDSSRSGRR